jgi:uncharacterized protein (DUF2384 family)
MEQHSEQHKKAGDERSKPRGDYPAAAKGQEQISWKLQKYVGLLDKVKEQLLAAGVEAGETLPNLSRAETSSNMQEYLGLLEEGKPAGYQRVLKRAAKVIGEKNTALLWLHKPIRELNDKTPYAVLKEGPKGVESVLNVLIKLEHGVL